MATYSGGGAIVKEVDKTEYISDPTSRKKGTNTPNSETFEDWLKDKKPADLDIQMVFPWGCVMGLRDATGAWKFYLQENATILFTKWKKKSVFSSQKVQSSMSGAARPMIFEIFPNGGMHHVFCAAAATQAVRCDVISSTESTDTWYVGQRLLVVPTAPTPRNSQSKSQCRSRSILRRRSCRTAYLRRYHWIRIRSGRTASRILARIRCLSA